MGMVTDVNWECPGCGTANIAQLYGFYKQGEFSNKSVPSNAELKWNPPCEGCGEFRLEEPEVTYVEFPVVECLKGQS